MAVFLFCATGHRIELKSLERTLSPFKKKERMLGEADRKKQGWGAFQSMNPFFFFRTVCTHAPGVPAGWPMRGSPPSMSSWTGVVSCSAVITMVFSSTSSQLGLENADRGRLILCILRSYTRCSCCFFMSRPLEAITTESE